MADKELYSDYLRRMSRYTLGLLIISSAVGPLRHGVKGITLI